MHEEFFIGNNPGPSCVISLPEALATAETYIDEIRSVQSKAQLKARFREARLFVRRVECLADIPAAMIKTRFAAARCEYKDQHRALRPDHSATVINLQPFLERRVIADLCSPAGKSSLAFG